MKSGKYLLIGRLDIFGKLVSLILAFLLLTVPVSSLVLGTSISNISRDTDTDSVFSSEGSNNESSAPQVLVDNESTSYQEVKVNSVGADKVAVLSDIGNHKLLPGFYIYTKCNGVEKRTKLILGLRKPIDVDNDGDADIRVLIRMYPRVVMSPIPSLSISTQLVVKRLSDDIKYSNFEIAGEVSFPKIIAKIIGGEKNVRFGFSSPEGKTVPKMCTVSYTIIPHILSIRKRPENLLDINPIIGIGDHSELLLFAAVQNSTSGDVSTIGIDYNPAVHSRIRWGRVGGLKEWHFFISRNLLTINRTTATIFFLSGGTTAGIVLDKLTSASFYLKLTPLSKCGGNLHYQKDSIKASSVSMFIHTVNMSGSLYIHNLPEEITVCWLLRPSGFIEVNTHGEETGEVTATVKGISSISFDPQTSLDVRIAWSNVTKNGLNLDIDSNVSINIRDMYVYGFSYNNSTGSYESFPVLENGNLNLLGRFGLKSHLILPEIKKGIIMNSTVKIFVEDASLDFTADNLSGMGKAAVSLFNTGKTEIDLLNFTMDNSSVLSEEELNSLPEDYLVQPWEYAPWMNGTVFINTNNGKLTLSLLDIESFSSFGHTIIKNLTGSGKTNVEFHLISMYLGNPLIVTNGPGTNITLEEFSFRFFGMPITIYDAKLVEGIFNFYFEMWTDHWITAEIRNGSGIERAGISIEPLGMIPSVDEMDFKLHFYWSEPIHYLYFDWYVHDWLNALKTGTPLYQSFVIDTKGIDTHLDMYATVFDKYGIKFDNLTLNALDTNLTINLEGIDLSNPSSIISALSNITLTGNLTILNFGKTIEIMINGTWYPIIQSGSGYSITVEHGHIRITGNKRIVLNETFTIPGTDLDVTLAGDFSFGNKTGVMDIWLTNDSIQISGNVNFTVKDFYLAVGDNFSMSAELFNFNLGTEASGEIEIGPTPSGSGRITLTKVNVKLDNCTIIFRGPIPIPDTPPTVNIFSPLEGNNVNGTVTIRGNATDVDGEVTQVQLSIDNGEWTNASYSNETQEWSYNWDTTLIPNGLYSVQVRAFDGIDYSDIATVNVTIDNSGANWRPRVNITYPEEGSKINGTIEIRGTADDRDGSVELVQIQIDDGPWQNATGTTSWTFEWNTTGMVGKHTIRTRAVDDKDDSSAIESIDVTLKLSLKGAGAVELSLIDANIDVKNLAVKMEITGVVILADKNPEITTEVKRLTLGGVGNVSMTLSPDGIAIETGGVGRGAYSTLDIYLNVTIPSDEGNLALDTEISTSGRITGPLSFYYNSSGILLAGDFGFDRDLNFDVNRLSGVINGTDISAELHMNLLVNLSAHGFVSVRWNETGLQSINANFDSDIDGYVRLYDVNIIAGDYGGRLKTLTIRGNGGLKINGNQFSVRGNLQQANLENLYVWMPGQNISLSGGLSTSRYTNLSMTINSLKDFIFSSDGSFSLNKLFLSIETGNLTASAHLGSLILNADSYLRFKYIEDNLNVSCNITAHKIHAENITLSYGNRSLHLSTIDFEGYEIFNLNSPVYVEQGNGYLKIVVGGKGQANLTLDTVLDVNGKKLGISGHIELRNGEDNLTIYVSNLSGNATVDIDGSAVASIENFHLWYGDVVDVKIPSIAVAFTLSTTKKVGSINIVGVSTANINADLSINKKDLSISGHFSFQGNLEGNITLSWNENGITYIGGDVKTQADVQIQMENILLVYGNFSLSCDTLYINGGINLYLEADGSNLHLYMQSSGSITVYNLQVKVGFYEGSYAIFGTITVSGYIDITLHFVESTATMLSSSDENKVNDTNALLAFLDNLVKFVRWW